MNGHSDQNRPSESRPAASVEPEIVALRETLAKVRKSDLEEAQLATAVARLVNALVQAVKLQRAIDGPPPHPTVAEIDVAWRQLNQMGARHGVRFYPEQRGQQR
jgi:hypothetical protein